jgi:hypothetical protein
MIQINIKEYLDIVRHVIIKKGHNLKVIQIKVIKELILMKDVMS